MKNPPAPVTEGHQHCFKCDTTKPVEDFYRSVRADRPKQRYKSWCKACHRAHYATPEWKQWYIDHQRKMRAEKRAVMSAVKVETGCEDCGERHPACLEFHHRNPSEKVTEVVKLIDQNASLTRIRLEADKCAVLCSNCHRKRHYIEREAVKTLRLA